MSEDDRSAQFIQKTLEELREKGPDAEREAIHYFMVDPSQPAADKLWSNLVIGLLCLAGIALIGMIALLALGKSSDIVLTAFTALLTGLLGLFIKSPVKDHA